MNNLRKKHAINAQADFTFIDYFHVNAMVTGWSQSATWSKRRPN